MCAHPVGIESKHEGICALSSTLISKQLINAKYHYRGLFRVATADAIKAGVKMTRSSV